MWVNLLLLLKNKSAIPVIISVIASTVIFVFYQQNESLRELNVSLAQQLVECQLKSQQARVQYDANLKTLEDSIAVQTAALEKLKSASAEASAQLNKSKQKIAQLTKDRDELIKKMRDTPVGDLTCAQSVELLKSSTAEVNWHSRPVGDTK